VTLRAMSGMTPSPIIVDLFTQDLHVESHGILRADQRRMTAGVDADWRSAIFHAETNDDVHADHWEMHPLADEAVCCLRGATRIYVRAVKPGTPDELVPLLPCQAAIVPRGRWHRLEVDEPTDLLALTVRRGTQFEKRDDQPRTRNQPAS
jgi:hypothetical protein